MQEKFKKILFVSVIVVVCMLLFEIRVRIAGVDFSQNEAKAYTGECRPFPVITCDWREENPRHLSIGYDDNSAFDIGARITCTDGNVSNISYVGL